MNVVVGLVEISDRARIAATSALAAVIWAMSAAAGADVRGMCSLGRDLDSGDIRVVEQADAWIGLARLDARQRPAEFIGEIKIAIAQSIGQSRGGLPANAAVTWSGASIEGPKSCGGFRVVAVAVPKTGVTIEPVRPDSDVGKSGADAGIRQ